MLERIKHYWFGYLLIQISGFSAERFFNLCSANQIPVWNLGWQGDCCRFYISIKGFRKTKPLAKKSKVRLKIVKKFGLPFFLYRNRRRKFYFAGVTAFFLLLYTMSLFVWDIEFEGNQMYTYDTLIQFFQTQDVSFGMMKYKVDCEALEAALRNEFSEITWVSARVSGTRLLVKIKENEVLSSIPERDESPCDLVAGADGVITSMIVRKGIPKVSVGDQVTKGQILVSGLIPITNDGEEVVAVHEVQADADIFAKTSYSYSREFSLLHRVTAMTGKERRGFYLKCFDYSFLILLPKKADTTWKLWMEETQLKLFENFYLPVYLGDIRAKEYVAYERFYTEEEKKQEAEAIHQAYIKNLMEKGVQIIENNVKILDNESNCMVEGNFITVEPITQRQRISESAETGESDERNRDND